MVLAPSLVLFPLSLSAAKIWTLLWGVLALFLFHQWLRRTFSASTALAGTMLLAFNPMTLVLSTEVLSEAPFLCVLMWAFILLDRITEDPSDKRSLVILVALLSVVMLLREVAVMLVIAVSLLFFIRREPGRAALVIGGAAALYGVWLFRNLVLVGTPLTSQSTNLRFVFEHVVTPPDAPLAMEMLTRLWLNIQGFGSQLGGMLFYSVPTTLVTLPSDFFRTVVNLVGDVRFIVMALVTPLMVGGVILDVRTAPAGPARLLFLLGYLGIVLTYPIHDVRFLLPLLPLMIYTAFLSIRWLMLRPFLHRLRAHARFAPVTAAVLLFPNYVCIAEILATNVAYRSDPGAFHDRTHTRDMFRTYFSEPWGLLGAWIQAHVPDDAVIACSAKEIVPFIAPRKVLEINAGVPLPIFERMLRENGAEYLVAVGIWENITSYEFAMAESRRFRFEPIHSVANLHVFRIHSRWLTPQADRLGWTFQFDTTTAAGLLRKGRWDMLHHRYALADSAFQRAEAFMPQQPLILFQRLLLNTFREDSAQAVQVLGRMFSTARATTYLWAARQHIDAMNAARFGRRIRVPQQRAMQLYDVARLYWDLGYSYQSYALLQDIVRTDSTFFTGLLWTWHYGIQLGDSTGAARRLGTLERMDASNPVVASFRRITREATRLKTVTDPRERRDIRFAIAREYEAIELPEEALDEMERAISENPADAESWSAYAALLDRLGKTRAAAHVRKHASVSGPA
ncbi:MAG: glycosyltransferase family 39 protein [Bacteroidetes bacterium]|nr:glycosyltransferase family 39 protein [Bacteroidota bacterium]